MMGPSALNANDRNGLMKLNEYDFSLLLIASEDFPRMISLRWWMC